MKKNEADIRKKIIEQYISCRKCKGMTQKDMAEAMGVARPSITRFESGNYNPSLDMLIRMAEKMDLNIEIVLKEKEVR